MCGQFILTKSWDDIYFHLMKHLNIIENPNFNLSPRNRIFPTNTIPIVIDENSTKHVIEANWQFLPSWASAENPKYKKVINARRDTITRNIEDKRGYYYSAIKQYRCLIPMNGYYEWQRDKQNPKIKTPYLIHFKDDELAFFSGIFSLHDEMGIGFAIITDEPSSHISHIHDRMPIILKEDAYDDWLNDKYYLMDVINILDHNKNADLIAHELKKGNNLNNNNKSNTDLLL